MPKFPFHEIDPEAVRKDFFSALLAWVVFVAFSFVLLPGLKLIETEKEKQMAWLLTSAPLGVIGSGLLAASSELIRICQEEFQGGNKLLIRLGLLGSWLGSAGIISPLIIVGLELVKILSH